MKKLLTVLLTLLMVFTISGCNSSSQDEPIVDNPVIEEDTPLVGGFTEVEDGTLTEELTDIFNKALDGLMGATYEPVELVATQVVAGTNYKFLANGTKTTNPITKGTYYITIYKDLQGDVKLLDIETIERLSEDVAKRLRNEKMKAGAVCLKLRDRAYNERSIQKQYKLHKLICKKISERSISKVTE